MTDETFRPATILLVEDNPGDARLVEEAFHEHRLYNACRHVTDGEQALDYLYGRNGYEGAPRPDVVLLDLNLPRKDGREVLDIIKADEALHRIPVVALTTSAAQADVEHCYASGANAYITKPVDFEKFIDVVKLFEQFWFSVVTLPR